MAVPPVLILWYACSMTKVMIDSEVATALINYVLIMDTRTTRSSTHSMCTAGTQYTNGLADSPQCERSMGYACRMPQLRSAPTARQATPVRVTTKIHMPKIHMSERAYLIMGSIALELIIWVIMCLACPWS